MLAGERAVVGRGGLIAVGRPPDVTVGQGTEMRDGLDGLVSGTVLTKTDRVVGGNPDDLVVAKRRQTDGTSSI